MESITQHLDLQTNTIRFANFFQKCCESDSLYIISGPRKSGKSVSIDLLTDKTITQQQLDGDQKVMVQDQNFQCSYDPIHIQYQQKSVFLQGFTLDQNRQRYDLNPIKYIFMRQGMKKVAKLSFIIAVDQRDMQSIPQIIDHALENINLDNPENTKQVEIFAEHVYLLLTKTEQEDPCDHFKDMCDELIENSDSNVVKLILKKIQKQNRIGAFPNQELEENYGDVLREIFKPVAVKKDLILFLDQQQNDKSKNDSEDFASLLSLLHELTSTVFNLVHWIVKNQGQQEYQKSVKNLFRKEKWFTNIFVQKMVNKNWKFKGLSQRITRNLDAIKGLQKNQFFGFQVILQIIKGLTAILDSLRQSAPKKQGYTQLRGIALFLLQATFLFEQKQFNKKSQKIVTLFDEILKLLSKNEEESDMKSGSRRVDKKPGKKQSKFNIFKDKLASKQSNRQVLRHCLAEISQKQKQKNYEWNTMIFQLKTIRDLLRQFDSSTHKHYFSSQILQLYLYNDSSYQFQRLLDLYIKEQALSIDTARDLIPVLHSLQRYDAEIKIINYVISNCVEDQQFELMNNIKAKVIFQANQEYLKKNDKLPPGISRKLTLGISFDSLDKKIGGQSDSRKEFQQWQNFLNSNSFKKYLTEKQKT